MLQVRWLEVTTTQHGSLAATPVPGASKDRMSGDEESAPLSFLRALPRRIIQCWFPAREEWDPRPETPSRIVRKLKSAPWPSCLQ